KFDLRDGSNSVSHGLEVRRTEGLQQNFSISLQTHRIWNLWVLIHHRHGSGDDLARAQVSAGRQFAHTKTQRLEPAKLVIGKVRKAAESEGLGHQAEVLQHHALFDGDEFCHELFHLPDRGDSAMVWIVIEMATPATGEPG